MQRMIKEYTQRLYFPSDSGTEPEAEE